MPGPETQWIRTHARKMDRELRARVLDTYRPPRGLPCWFARNVVGWKQRFERIPVVVRLKAECTAQDRSSLSRGMTDRGCKDMRDLGLINGVAAAVPVAYFPQLVSDDRVQRVTYDRAVHALLDVAAPSVLAPAVWDTGRRGAGVTVAVIDTGVHPHDDFTVPADRIVGFKDFIGERTDPYDDNGHGTHVAGIVAGGGTRSNGRYRGTAPEADLVGIKVLDRVGSGSLSTVIEGIQWSVEHRSEFGIRVLSLSLGAQAQDSYEDDPVAQAVGAAWEAGLVVCAAAGNDGPDAGTIATPGIHPRIVTVGASDDRETVDRSDDAVADFSGRGPTVDGLPKPDVVAPGVDITAPNAPKSVLALQQGRKNADYLTLSGTSMATPACSGIAALILEREPELDPDGVKRRLRDSAASLGDDINSEGEGLVNAEAAIATGEAVAAGGG